MRFFHKWKRAVARLSFKQSNEAITLKHAMRVFNQRRRTRKRFCFRRRALRETIVLQSKRRVL